MPFANKFRFTMRLPEPGKRIGDFTVESCSVEHDPSGYGRYEYRVEIVMKGKGGQQGVRRAAKDLLAPVKTTFSAYGNAYQLRFGKMEVESLGDQRYSLHGIGLGARVFLRKEVERFCDYLCDEGLLSEKEKSKITDRYIEAYRIDARRKRPDRET